MKKMLNGLLLGGAIGMSVVLGCKSMLQVLRQQRDQNAARSLRNAYVISMTQKKHQKA